MLPIHQPSWVNTVSQKCRVTRKVFWACFLSHNLQALTTAPAPVTQRMPDFSANVPDGRCTWYYTDLKTRRTHTWSQSTKFPLHFPHKMMKWLRQCVKYINIDLPDSFWLLLTPTGLCKAAVGHRVPSALFSGCEQVVCPCRALSRLPFRHRGSVTTVWMTFQVYQAS